ncbi:MAG: hypothetical protein LBO67_01290 [Spirochaetaceae bacterium]|jgi:hypothetical protein|nr:hypothetical protein [Spirochaetaceae bacterium]
MEYIKGITFAPFAHRGVLASKEARHSLELLHKRTGADHVLLAPTGVQETPYSEHIDFSADYLPQDDELIDSIRFAQSLGLKVILKPTVNCANGVWRAYINFFDTEVPGEPQWSRWYAAHERFQLHYAALAEKTGCVMFIMGCEMVMAERREAHWRDLAAKIKALYHGPLSYNTDKYQEDQVRWWDCVDNISSSGYYPSGSWDRQLDRIEKVVRHFDKPFFFAETGCMSAVGAAQEPNNWRCVGAADPGEQERWYEEMFERTVRRSWIQGTVLWDWPPALYPEEEAHAHTGYAIYAKPAEAVVRRYYAQR